MKLSKTLFTKAFETQQNAFYESVLGSSTVLGQIL
ncbi:hypothetical protein LEP1GSC008_1184, partial [Leptospira kirschneri serovar Bulgarica str. Nikolaevo]